MINAATKKLLEKNPPTTPGGIADHLLRMRDARLELAGTVDKFKKRERELTESLVGLLKGNDVRSVTGRVATFSYKIEEVPTVKDWPSFYKYVSRTKGFDLLQRRLSPAAFRERWDARKKIPGVEKMPVEKTSLTKSKR